MRRGSRSGMLPKRFDCFWNTASRMADNPLLQRATDLLDLNQIVSGKNPGRSADRLPVGLVADFIGVSGDPVGLVKPVFRRARSRIGVAAFDIEIVTGHRCLRSNEPLGQKPLLARAGFGRTLDIEEIAGRRVEVEHGDWTHAGRQGAEPIPDGARFGLGEGAPVAIEVASA